jgi:hypothetical protein
MNLISENNFTSFKHNNEIITYEIYKNVHDIINKKVINKKVINKKVSINQLIKLNKLKELEELENKFNIMIIKQMEKNF